MARRHVYVVVNPAAGPGLGPSLVSTHIRPLLVSTFGADAVSIHESDSPSHLADSDRLSICDKLLQGSSEGVLDLVLVGGDGTTHGILTQLYTPRPDGKQDERGEDERGEERRERGFPKIRLALVPAGTANALYSGMYPHEWTQERQRQAANASTIGEIPADVVEVMLNSVRALVNAANDKLVRLPLMLDEMHNAGREVLTLSHLVTSHALHAAILHDADTPEMRAKHKGIERFKVAAQMNATKWIGGEITLHPQPHSGVERYSPRSKQFEQVSRGELKLDGPFLYLNAMVTDRLESAFIPAPLSSAFTSPGLSEAVLDVVIIRPHRDPCCDSGERFAMTRLGPITGGMYDGGTHIDLTYSSDEPMVEYFRCSAYDFLPEAEGKEDKSRLVCTDGHVASADRVRVSRWDSEVGKQKRTEAAQKGLVRDMDAPLVWR